MTIEQATKALSGQSHAVSESDADFALRYREGAAFATLLIVGTYYIPLLRAPKALSVANAYIVPDTTQAAHATTSRDFALVKDDGAGGGYTVLGTEIDGTASGITALQASDLAAVEGTSNVAEGEYLYLRSTAQATGLTLDLGVVFDYRYD